MSHQSQSRSFVSNRPLVPVTGVPLCSGRLRPHLEAGTLCGVVVAGSAATSMMHEICEPEEEVAASISVCVTECS